MRRRRSRSSFYFLLLICITASSIIWMGSFHKPERSRIPEHLDKKSFIGKRKPALKNQTGIKWEETIIGKGIEAQVLIHHEPAKEEERPHPDPDHILTAYLEPSFMDDWNTKPLPTRKTKASLLTKIEYPALRSCSKLPEQFPVDDGPTDHDPFLPWIHDVFPSNDGKYIHFVAQNRRRCKLGPINEQIMEDMLPQQALFQNAPMKRIQTGDGQQRYRLSNYEEADADSYMTRFICRFKPSMQETLSTFDFDYDWASYRKRYKKGFTRQEGQIKQIHTSQLVFRCPVPDELQTTIQTGESIKNDYATLFLDLIPIRTPPRWGDPQQFFQPKYKTFELRDGTLRFNASLEYGSEHVLPLIEDSGRWSNIPICLPSRLAYPKVKTERTTGNKAHHLSACIWASSGYTARGNKYAVNDGQRRLLEWVAYNRMLGVDHFYVYDNSMALTNQSSLAGIADLFPDDVTYIPWPAIICNNNIPKHKSPGERSSQYAAESSCRLRFGPDTEWIGQFDIDEYVIPMGKFRNFTELLNRLDAEDKRVVSFASFPAMPRRELLGPMTPIHDETICKSKESCFAPSIPLNQTLLQTFNCDRYLPGAKQDADPAEKQFYKPDYVLQHFVHYSAVTVTTDKNRSEYEKEGFEWKGRGIDPRTRFADEATEGLMIHARNVPAHKFAGFEASCHENNTQEPKRKRKTCRVGTPWPRNDDTVKADPQTGMLYNCYINEKVENEIVPRLEKVLKRILSQVRVD